MDFYEEAGWREKRQETEIDLTLESIQFMDAWKDGELIGYARALIDENFRAYVEDVVIRTQFQKTRIGRNL